MGWLKELWFVDIITQMGGSTRPLEHMDVGVCLCVGGAVWRECCGVVDGVGGVS